MEGTPRREARDPQASRRWRTVVYLVLIPLTIPFEPFPGSPAWRQVAIVGATLAAMGAVLVRERRPLLLPALAVLSTPVNGGSLLTPALVSLAIRRRDGMTALVAVLAALVLLVPSLTSEYVAVELSGPGAGSIPATYVRWISWGLNVVMVAVALLMGAMIGTRRDLLASYRDRAERAEAERSLRAREAVLLERARIAREMHDVLGHRLSLLTMQAGGLEVNASAGAELVEREAGLIRRTAREALADLRVVVGALEDADAPRSPAPGLADIGALVAASRAAGAHVDLDDSLTGTPGATTIDPAVGRAVHRVLTEALTNAHRHAPGLPVRVDLRGEPGSGFDLLVENHLPATAAPSEPGEGTGLTGLAERVRLVGGRFEANQQGRVFRVRARLPWPVAPEVPAREDARP